ncbi:MAG: ATP synthase F1 subunit delta [Clostridia bacterium]|nr:ATP synthase F1 subunit delta [Clostridia bacterium]
MKSLSSVYAASLFSLADEENLLSETMDELLALRSVFLENADYAPLLDSPTVSLSSRLSLIDEAFEGASEYVKNFIKILCEKKCTHLFSECVKNFEKLYNKKYNIENVTVIAAFPLSEALREKLTRKLSDDLKKKVILDLKVDESILGGLIIRTENSQTDASVRARLDAIKAQLSAEAK